MTTSRAPSLLRSLVLLCAVALAATGCSLLERDGGLDSGGGARGAAAGESGGVPVELPSPVAAAAFTPLTFDRVAGEDRIATAVAVSRRYREAADTVVLARADAYADALAAAPLAAHEDAPVLLSPTDRLPVPVAEELDRLGAGRVLLLGGEAALSAAVADELADRGLEVERIAGRDRYATAAAIAARVPPAGRVYVVTGTDYPDALAAGAAAARLPAPVLLVGDSADPAVRQVVEDQRPSELVVVGGTQVVPPGVVDALAGEGRTVERLAGADRYATAAAVHAHVVDDFGGPSGTWLASGAGFADALAAGPAAATEDATLLLAAPDDLADSAATVEALGVAGGSVTIVGGSAAVTDQAPRQIRAVLAGNTLPRGGTILFPDHRMVAYYGNAEYPALGVLGETSPEQAVDRVEEVAAEYADGSRAVLPAFELIVTVASADPESDGNYSEVGDLADVRRWVDVAREHDLYVFLDFQPGRNRFLEQVRLFDEFLRQPHVGVALDPEWRMTQAQRPGQVIGSADAAEINEVADHLAEIVRTEDLPQKLFVVHQFRESMIRDRDQLRTPPELAVTVHVDGFGDQGAKLETWNTLARADAPWFHGFKLFYDEDTNLFSPEQILDFAEPPVDLVTYQ